MDWFVNTLTRDSHYEISFFLLMLYLEINNLTMKLKVIIIVFIIVGLSGGGFYYYKHTYVDTLLISEIVGHSENNLVNIGYSLLT